MSTPPTFLDILNNARYSTKKESRPPGSQPRRRPPKILKRKPERPVIATNPPSFLIRQNQRRSSLYNVSDTLPYFDQCFDVMEKIGEGSFGEVYKARDLETNEFYAVKIVKTFGIRNKFNRVIKVQEVSNYESVPPHENIVSLVNAWEQDDFVYIQMELGYTSLDQYAEDNEEFTKAQLWNVLLDMLLALKNLHENCLVHLDVKLENIILSKTGICKLSDFGLMLNLRDRSRLQHASEGDAKYLAVELMDGKFTKAADVFSLGISILELASDLDLPSHGQLWHNLRSGRFPDQVTKYVPKELLNVIRRMMTKDFKKRPSVKTLLRHPRFKKMLKQRKDAAAAGKEIEGRLTPPACVPMPDVGIPATPPNNGFSVHHNLSSFVTPTSGYSTPDFRCLSSIRNDVSRQLSFSAQPFGDNSMSSHSSHSSQSLFLSPPETRCTRNSSYSSAKKLFS